MIRRMMWCGAAVAITMVGPGSVSSVAGANAPLPTPIYDLQFNNPGDATGLNNAVWAAGVSPHTGIVETTDPNNGGSVSPTSPSSTVSLSFPFTVRVGIQLSPTQGGSDQWQRLWSLFNGPSDNDVVSIQHWSTNPDLGVEFLTPNGRFDHMYPGGWTLITDGLWHDVIVSVTDASNIVTYVDGVALTESGSVSSTPELAFIANSKGVYLGISSFGDPNPVGAWDFFQIYNQALTQNQVNTAAAQFSGAIVGDPQISGLQGQNFQFHGIPGEVFNLISSQTFQLNSKFVYLANGTCTYNHTACWSHPGTYLSHLGFMIPGHHVELIAGSHKHGLSLMVDEIEMRIPRISTLHENTTRIHSLDTRGINMRVTHLSHQRVRVSVPSFDIMVWNADGFFNLAVTVTDPTLLQSGIEFHHFKNLYTSYKDTAYPSIPIHGLIGQTWKNAVYGDAHQLYEGVPDAYMLQSRAVFGMDFEFNQYLESLP